MLFLFGAGNPETGGGSITGLQDPTYTQGFVYAANTVGSIPDNFALAVLYAIVTGSPVVNLGEGQPSQSQGQPSQSQGQPSQSQGQPSQREETPAYLLIDHGAINSLLTTGLLMPVVQRQAVQNAASGAIRDLNSRLFRARALGREATPGDGPIHSRLLDGLIRPFESTADTSTIRYLNFAAAQRMDYRVALGLRDGVEVEYENDTMALGDTFWATSPFALTGGPVILAAAPGFTKAVIAAPEGSAIGGKEVFEDKVVILEPAFKRFEVFSEFDYGFYDQDSLTNLVRGFDSDTYAASAGMEYRVFPWLHVGGAFTYLENNTDVSSNLGSVDLDGTLLSGYFTAFWKQFYLDALYSYGDFDNEISRNTLLGRHAHGDTESYAHNIDVNLGYNHRLSDQIQTGPYTGLNYATGGIDGYTERNGANANLVYPDDNYESMIGRLGWQMSYTTDTMIGQVTAQGRVGWAREFMPEADTVRAGLASSPFVLVTGNSAHRVGGFATEADSAHAGTDWLELGAGLRLDLDESWNVQLDYEGQFARNNASAHFAAVKLEYEWGDVFLPGLGGGKGVVVEVGGGSDPLEGAIAAAPASPAKSGWKTLFAGKSASPAPSAPATESTEEAPSTEPYAAAKPAAQVSVLGDGPMQPGALPRASGDADKPVIYESWDQVPGRQKISAPAAEPAAKPVPQEASAAPAQDEKAEDHSVPIVSTGPVTAAN